VGFAVHDGHVPDGHVGDAGEGVVFGGGGAFADGFEDESGKRGVGKADGEGVEKGAGNK
jgi:hypothetical protein